MARPHALALAAAWGLLTAAPAWAQPSGEGWFVVVSCEPGQYQSSPFPAAPASALVAEMFQLWGDGLGEYAGRLPVYGGSAGDAYCQGQRFDGEAFIEVGVTVYARWLPLPSSESEKVADLLQLWGLGLGALASIWAMKAFVLKLLTNQ